VILDLTHGRFAHHALKALPIASAAGVALTDIRGRNAALNFGGYAAVALAVLLGVIAYYHTRHADHCPSCRHHPEDRLKRPHYRALLHFSRWCGAFSLVTSGAILVMMGILMATGVIPYDEESRETSFDLQTSLPLFSAALLITLTLSVTRFRNANQPGLQPYTPFRNYLAGPGQNLRHRGFWLIIAAVIVNVALHLTPDTAVWAALQGLGTITLLTLLYIDHQHTLSLCEQCVTQFPTDAPEHAAARKWRFSVFHRCGWVPLAAMVGQWTGQSFVDGLWDTAFYALTWSAILLLTLLGRFHNAYQPWCPICHPGRGGDEHEEVPDPTPGSGRPLPVA
jgi:hypothetical protein